MDSSRRSHIRVLNLGAGVQSTAVALMSQRGELPRVDIAIFADTGEEPRAVYDHLEWLIRHVTFPVLRRSYGKLGDDLLSGRGPNQNFRNIPAFLASEEGRKEGIGWRQCTYNYKVKVIDETIKRELFGLAPRQHVPPGFSCTNVTGLSWDEPMRVAKVRGKNCAWQTFECPLFDMQWTRAKCAAWLRDKVPHIVPRSACVFCPYHNNEEWRHIRDHDQEGWQRALTIDRALREDAACSCGLRKAMYLHSSCVPLERAEIDTAESRKDQYLFGFARECDGMCGL